MTKYRYAVLEGDVAVRCRDLIREICQAQEVSVVRGAVSPDHVHLLVSAPPILAPAKLAQYLKGSSSRRWQEEFPSLRKRYWAQPLWARGYFCATVGAVDEKTIKRYWMVCAVFRLATPRLRSCPRPPGWNCRNK